MRDSKCEICEYALKVLGHFEEVRRPIINLLCADWLFLLQNGRDAQNDPDKNGLKQKEFPRKQVRIKSKVDVAAMQDHPETT